MNILHFSTEDITGGAAKAAHRLHSALREAGHQSRMIVRQKKSDDEDVVQAPPPSRPLQSRVDRLRRHIPGIRPRMPATKHMFNFDLQPEVDLSAWLECQSEDPDVICLHWISGMLDSPSIRRLYEHFHCPMIWVMADQEPMTGGCHYSFGCQGFRRQCGICPQLNSIEKEDQSRATWSRKKEHLADLPICFVAPTSWGRERIRQSSLFQQHRVELIPYPIAVQTFRPFDQRVARDLLHLPQDKKVLFFGATYLEDERKGMKQLIEALTGLAELLEASEKLKRDDIFLLIAGLNGKQLMSNLPLSGKYAGHFNDELTLALAYQAADIFVCPSMEDAGPMMIPEAMLCGTPVAAFDTGGAPDLIETMETGYLAQVGDALDLARGIYGLLAADNAMEMRVGAYRKALKAHEPQHVAAQYSELCQSLVSK